MSRFWHAWKVARGALIFTVFYVGGAFLGLFVLPLASLGERDRTRRHRRNHRLITWTFRFTLHLLRWARIIDFDPRTVEPGLPGHPVLVIANHPTTIDVVAVLSVYREAAVVVKEKIWKDRFLRHLFRYTAHINGGDGSMASSLRVLDEVRERLSQGFDVVIFPEGTRSPPHDLAPFAKGAFAVATQTRSDILPLVLTANPPALHKAAPWHRLPPEPVEYRIVPLPLVRVAGENTSARRLQAEVTGLYRAALGLDGSSPGGDTASSA